MDPLDRLIVALDVMNMEKAMSLVSELDRVKCFKIGPQLFLSGGEEVVRFIKHSGAEVVLDLKLHDIQKVVVETAAVVNKYEIDYLTIHASVGCRTLSAAVKAAPNVKILSVVALTNEDPDSFPNFEPREKATMAKSCGVAGCVTSGAFIADVKMRFPEGLSVVPGVRLNGEDADDQVCVITPEYAVRFGADKIIMGRPIYKAEDPNKAVDEVLERISMGLK